MSSHGISFRLRSIIILSAYLFFLSCTSLNVLRNEEEVSKYKPAAGDSVLIETKQGKFYKSVIVDTTGSYITTENHKIEKSYITSIIPLKDTNDLVIILITGMVAYGFLYMLAHSLNPSRR